VTIDTFYNQNVFKVEATESAPPGVYQIKMLAYHLKFAADGAETTLPNEACATWEVKTYTPGDQICEGGKLWECKPFPYDGWCGTASYCPTCTNGAEAWIDLGEVVPLDPIDEGGASSVFDHGPVRIYNLDLEIQANNGTAGPVTVSKVREALNGYADTVQKDFTVVVG